MSGKALSPKSSLRKSIRDINRSRGHGNNNLWYFYSPKTDKDWVLPSDVQFVHWLYFLEANPAVMNFDLAPGVTVSSDDEEPRGTELDAIVVFRDGHIEWHEVKAGEVLLDSDSSTMQVEDKLINLTPGMAVTVEVKTASRRVIEYFLSPLMTYKDESLRER